MDFGVLDIWTKSEILTQGLVQRRASKESLRVKFFIAQQVGLEAK